MQDLSNKLARFLQYCLCSLFLPEGQMVQTTIYKNDDDSALSYYFKEINAVPLLSREEEIELCAKAASGDKRAKEKIVNANLRFVVKIAKKYQGKGLDLEDLISEGNIGLLIAIERFEAARGYHFISYAVWWIRQAILKAICEKSRAIRLPLNRANELVQIEKARKSIGKMASEEDEIREIARVLGMEQNLVKDLIDISREMISLDCAIASDADSSTFGDFIEDTSSEQPEEYAIYASMQDDIDTVIATLPEKEAEIIRLRFGLGGKKAMSLKEIGDEFKVTKERIRQIEKKALLRLQHPTRTCRLEGYVA